MTNYIIRRFLESVLVLFFLSFVVYGLMGLMPGDPLDVACASNPRCSPANIQEMKHQLGLDRPIYERYAKWLGSAVKGDFGYSRTYRKPTSEILWPRLKNTMVLGVFCLMVSFVIALPMGIFSSLRARTWVDYIINFGAFMGISAPAFWLGLMLIITFSVWLGWFPAGGVNTIGQENAALLPWLLDRGKYLVLPVASLSLQTVADWVRFSRSQMLEVMRMDYIRTARSKGLPEHEVVIRHGVRNAMLNVVTMIGLNIPIVVSGALITETVFAYQGVGKLMIDSIIGNDFNVVMVCFLLDCMAVLAASLLVDIVRAYLDPRISLK